MAGWQAEYAARFRRIELDKPAPSTTPADLAEVVDTIASVTAAFQRIAQVWFASSVAMSRDQETPDAG